MKNRFNNHRILPILVLIVAATGYAQMNKYPDEYKFGWRQKEDKPHVLWIGGGHWHHTCETCAILRPDLENEDGLFITYSEDSHSLMHLEDYDVIVLQAMLESLTPEEETTLIEAVKNGKPLLSLHAACASFRKPPPDQKFDPVAGHPEFYKMIGGYVQYHPPFQAFTVSVVDAEHSITEGIGDFEILDELFVMVHQQPDNHILLEAEFKGKSHPQAWTRNCGEGKVFLMTLGHSRLAAENPAFQQLVRNALSWLFEE